jgi:hypothetical protein
LWPGGFNFPGWNHHPEPTNQRINRHAPTLYFNFPGWNHHPEPIYLEGSGPLSFAFQLPRMESPSGTCPGCASGCSRGWDGFNFPGWNHHPELPRIVGPAVRADRCFNFPGWNHHPEPGAVADVAEHLGVSTSPDGITIRNTVAQAAAHAERHCFNFPGWNHHPELAQLIPAQDPGERGVSTSPDGITIRNSGAAAGAGLSSSSFNFPGWNHHPEPAPAAARLQARRHGFNFPGWNHHPEPCGSRVTPEDAGVMKFQLPRMESPSGTLFLGGESVGLWLGCFNFPGWNHHPEPSGLQTYCAAKRLQADRAQP